MPAGKLYIHEQLEEFNSKLKIIEAEQMAHKTAVRELVAENVNLRYHLDALDAESRLSYLIIRGFPEVLYAEKTSGATQRNTTSAQMLDRSRHSSST